MSDRPESLAAALAELQQHLPRIGKDSAAVMPGKNGGRPWGYKYADLATISAALLPELGKLGLSFTACPTMLDGQFVLVCTLRHVSSQPDPETHWADVVQASYPLATSGSPQAIGSAITYARRYCLLAVTGAAPDEDDDDAQEAEQSARAWRAQRNMPPEVDEHGAATVTEQVRMWRGSEPGTERLSTTPVDDEFYAPIGNDVSPENKSGSSLPSQRQDIYIAMSKRGIHTPDARRQAIERLIQRKIDAAKDMAYTEAVSVLARVKSWDGRTEELLSPLVAERSQADA